MEGVYIYSAPLKLNKGRIQTEFPHSVKVFFQTCNRILLQSLGLLSTQREAGKHLGYASGVKNEEVFLSIHAFFINKVATLSHKLQPSALAIKCRFKGLMIK